MRFLLVALLCALSYAQTELYNIHAAGVDSCNSDETTLYIEGCRHAAVVLGGWFVGEITNRNAPRGCISNEPITNRMWFNKHETPTPTAENRKLVCVKDVSLVQNSVCTSSLVHAQQKCSGQVRFFMSELQLVTDIEECVNFYWNSFPAYGSEGFINFRDGRCMYSDVCPESSRIDAVVGTWSIYEFSCRIQNDVTVRPTIEPTRLTTASPSLPTNPLITGSCDNWCRGHTSTWDAKCAWETQACSACAECTCTVNRIATRAKCDSGIRFLDRQVDVTDPSQCVDFYWGAYPVYSNTGFINYRNGGCVYSESCPAQDRLENLWEEWEIWEYNCIINNVIDAPTKNPTRSPSATPSMKPTFVPTLIPTFNPSLKPTVFPTVNPSLNPIVLLTLEPTIYPSLNPTMGPTIHPTTMDPSMNPTLFPTLGSTRSPTLITTRQPNKEPSITPSMMPTVDPTTKNPSTEPTNLPTLNPSTEPTNLSTLNPSIDPTSYPTLNPIDPTMHPTESTLSPTLNPTKVPTKNPSTPPTCVPIPNSVATTLNPTLNPTSDPTRDNDCDDFARSAAEAISLGSDGCLVQFDHDGWEIDEYCGLYETSLCVDPTYGLAYSKCCPVTCGLCPACSVNFVASRSKCNDEIVVEDQEFRSFRGISQCVDFYQESFPTYGSSGFINYRNGACVYSESCPTEEIVTNLPERWEIWEFHCDTDDPTAQPSSVPSNSPTFSPVMPTLPPTLHPTTLPTLNPTTLPDDPTTQPSSNPSKSPTLSPAMPTSLPTLYPTNNPSTTPTLNPSDPTVGPTHNPTKNPTRNPTLHTTLNPTMHPTCTPSMNPAFPTLNPTMNPSEPACTINLVSERSKCDEDVRYLNSEVQNVASIVDCVSFYWDSYPTYGREGFVNMRNGACVYYENCPEKDRLHNLPEHNGDFWAIWEFRCRLTDSPTKRLTLTPSVKPTTIPTSNPLNPTTAPSLKPTNIPTDDPSFHPSLEPTQNPSVLPSLLPSMNPTQPPTLLPTSYPSLKPTIFPSQNPSRNPSCHPTLTPTLNPNQHPTPDPTQNPSFCPTCFFSRNPTLYPTHNPTVGPTSEPTQNPSNYPSSTPSSTPTFNPTSLPSRKPTSDPTENPSIHPSSTPSSNPTANPTNLPSGKPTSDPTQNPTFHPTSTPSLNPIFYPSHNPTQNPSSDPTHWCTINLVSERSKCDEGVRYLNAEVQNVASVFDCVSFYWDSYPTYGHEGFINMRNGACVYYESCPEKDRLHNLPEHNGDFWAIWEFHCRLTKYPTKNPTLVPSINPTLNPTYNPTNPTKAPTNNPSIHPSRDPSDNPSALPSSVPSIDPTKSPSLHPSSPPSFKPTFYPSQNPSANPSFQPTLAPTSNPNQHPTSNPTQNPSLCPTCFVSQSPTLYPIKNPTQRPSSSPTEFPSVHPSNLPSRKPTTNPTSNPSSHPTSTPSFNPTVFPSHKPTRSPTSDPIHNPSLHPTSIPSFNPTVFPSHKPTQSPTLDPTQIPSSHPTSTPTLKPTLHPSYNPTQSPTSNPTQNPSLHPTSTPTLKPTLHPSHNPTQSPTSNPTQNPSLHPTSTPTLKPTFYPSYNPTQSPSSDPTHWCTIDLVSERSKCDKYVRYLDAEVQNVASIFDCVSFYWDSYPTYSHEGFVNMRNGACVYYESCPEKDRLHNLPEHNGDFWAIWEFHCRLTKYPTKNPTLVPSINPSLNPTYNPTNPTRAPSLRPTNAPTSYPSLHPSLDPSENPSALPSSVPSIDPTNSPSLHPSSHPSLEPTFYPSHNPSQNPFFNPTKVPSFTPTADPTQNPSLHPTYTPSLHPTAYPSNSPTQTPSLSPTQNPSLHPTDAPSLHPTAYPSKSPTQPPSLSPTQNPSLHPTDVPSVYPTFLPTHSPTRTPSSLPTQNPSLPPSSGPSLRPTFYPTHNPSLIPTLQPTHWCTINLLQESSRCHKEIQYVNSEVLLASSIDECVSFYWDSYPKYGHSGFINMRDDGCVYSEICPESLQVESLEDWSIWKFECRLTADPTKHPSLAPSLVPTRIPSRNPTHPTTAPSRNPTNAPTNDPSFTPTYFPTHNPSLHPTLSPSLKPTHHPTQNPSQNPTSIPTRHPSLHPSLTPTIHPTSAPSSDPTVNPSNLPSRQPTSHPTQNPSLHPTSRPSFNPTLHPSHKPTQSPTSDPTQNPSLHPTSTPSLNPTIYPSHKPTQSPTSDPTHWCTINLVSERSKCNGDVIYQNSEVQLASDIVDCVSFYWDSYPTYGHEGFVNMRNGVCVYNENCPEADRLHNLPEHNGDFWTIWEFHCRLTKYPTKNPTLVPSISPTLNPTYNPTSPTTAPSLRPTRIPSKIPTSHPSSHPSSEPSSTPTQKPSLNPTLAPSFTPTQQPTFDPTIHPSLLPTSSPTLEPTNNPTCKPSQIPTRNPSLTPSRHPSCDPTVLPTFMPTVCPSTNPSASPTLIPSLNPSSPPSSSPSLPPTDHPSRTPTHSPTLHPIRQSCTFTLIASNAICDSGVDFSNKENGGSGGIADCVEYYFDAYPTYGLSGFVNMLNGECVYSESCPEEDRSTDLSEDWNIYEFSCKLGFTNSPTISPSLDPTTNPTSRDPTANPTLCPTAVPTFSPINPTSEPTAVSTMFPTNLPSHIPTRNPTSNPTSATTIDVCHPKQIHIGRRCVNPLFTISPFSLHDCKQIAYSRGQKYFSWRSHWNGAQCDIMGIETDVDDLCHDNPSDDVPTQWSVYSTTLCASLCEPHLLCSDCRCDTDSGSNWMLFELDGSQPESAFDCSALAWLGGYSYFSYSNGDCEIYPTNELARCVTDPVTDMGWSIYAVDPCIPTSEPTVTPALQPTLQPTTLETTLTPTFDPTAECTPIAVLEEARCMPPMTVKYGVSLLDCREKAHANEQLYFSWMPVDGGRCDSVQLGEDSEDKCFRNPDLNVREEWSVYETKWCPLPTSIPTLDPTKSPVVTFDSTMSPSMEPTVCQIVPLCSNCRCDYMDGEATQTFDYTTMYSSAIECFENWIRDSPYSYFSYRVDNNRCEVYLRDVETLCFDQRMTGTNRDWTIYFKTCGDAASVSTTTTTSDGSSTSTSTSTTTTPEPTIPTPIVIPCVATLVHENARCQDPSTIDHDLSLAECQEAAYLRGLEYFAWRTHPNGGSRCNTLALGEDAEEKCGRNPKTDVNTDWSVYLTNYCTASPSLKPTYYPTHDPTTEDIYQTVYWDLEECGPLGDNHNWHICGQHLFQCPDVIDAPGCPSGRAYKYRELGDGLSWGVEIAGCQYAYHVQYVCQDFPTLDPTAGPTRSFTQPNILLILADDAGTGDVPGFWDDEYWGDARERWNIEIPVDMPNLRALQERGVKFLDFHSTPVCAPSRYSILSGNYAWRGTFPGGIFNMFAGDSQFLSSQRSIAKILREEKGYHTGVAGKWGLGGRIPPSGASDICATQNVLTCPDHDWTQPMTKGPQDAGFDSTYVTYSGINGGPYAFFRNGHIDFDVEDTIYWTRGTHMSDRGSTTIQKPFEGDPNWDTSSYHEIILDESIKFLDMHFETRPEDPFFLYTSLGLTHIPFDEPYFFQDTPIRNEYTHSFYGQLKMKDLTVGALVDYLERKGVLDDTLIIFTSDNGGNPDRRHGSESHRTNGPLEGEKNSLYEGGHRVPLIMTWGNNFPHGETRTQLLGFTDLYATICDLAQVDLREDEAVDSVSFSEYIYTGDPTGLRERYAFWYTGFSSTRDTLTGPPRALRWNEYKLIQWSHTSRELYNLNEDLEETNDISGQSTNQGIIDDMIAYLDSLEPS